MPVPRTHRTLDRTVLVAKAYRRTTSRPHILRSSVDGEPIDWGLCGTETDPPINAQSVRVGDNPGALCQRCFGFYLHNWDEDRLPYFVA